MSTLFQLIKRTYAIELVRYYLGLSKNKTRKIYKQIIKEKQGYN